MAVGKPAKLFKAMLLGPMMSKKGGKIMGGEAARQSQKDLLVLKELLEAGKVVPAIDKQFPLSEGAEALRYLGAGHARGKVIITMV